MTFIVPPIRSRKPGERHFLTLIGHDRFAKLKTLVSLTQLNDLSLSFIVTMMTQHYKKDTVEIAEQFKFFKRIQQEKEAAANHVAELRKLQFWGLSGSSAPRSGSMQIK